MAVDDCECFLTGCGPTQHYGDSSGPWIVSIAVVELELAEFKRNNNNKKKNMKNFMGDLKDGHFLASYFGSISSKFGWTMG